MFITVIGYTYLLRPPPLVFDFHLPNAAVPRPVLGLKPSRVETDEPATGVVTV